MVRPEIQQFCGSVEPLRSVMIHYLYSQYTPEKAQSQWSRG